MIMPVFTELGVWSNAIIADDAADFSEVDDDALLPLG